MIPRCRPNLIQRLSVGVPLPARMLAVALLALCAFAPFGSAEAAPAHATCTRVGCKGSAPDDDAAVRDPAVGDQPAGCRDDDPNCRELEDGDGDREFRSPDDVFWALLARGEPVIVLYQPPSDEDLPPLLGFQPLAAARAPRQQLVPLRQVVAADVQIQPLGTPNYVSITLHYTEEQVRGLQESTLRMFFFDEQLGAWVELPSLVDPLGDTVTVMNVDVSAFANGLHRIAVYG